MSAIIAAGAYIPRNRLSRAAVLEANGWFNPALKSMAKGERAICNWDEDALTMAVEAARDCLLGHDRSNISRVVLASTTLPFADRQNAAILAQALNLSEALESLDVTSSLRAGTGALTLALSQADTGAQTLVVCSEHRLAKTASPQEMTFGDAAAAFLVGGGDALAEVVATHSVSVDFTDRYRAGTARFDYAWEERWARDEGQLKILPDALQEALDKAGWNPAQLDRLIVPLAAATARRLAKQLGVDDGVIADNLFQTVGDGGVAHPALLLARAFEEIGPDRHVALVGWGQGCDVLLLRTGGAAGKPRRSAGVAGHLARRRAETNYNKYLAFNGLIEQEKGIRSELDKQTAVSALYRNRDLVLGFVGGRCTACGTVQFPRTKVCVGPNCGKFRTQEPCPLADAKAHIQSWTADNLTYSPDPPHHFGMVVFDGGGRLMSDLTDVDPGAVESGMPVRMMFRIKDVDERRGFRRYFWKAAPVPAAAEA